MKKAVFITGPTSSGKSKLASYLAKKFNGEIINADSRQVYKYLDWGSGKIDGFRKIRKFKYGLILDGIKHYLVSVASPRKNYSLGRWLKDVERVYPIIIKNKKIPIFSGGTLLYLRALKEGWILPKVKPNYKLRKELEMLSLEELLEMLRKINKSALENLDIKNKRRVIRRLEIVLSLKEGFSLKKEPKYDLLIISPFIEKEKLFKKIEKRLKKRLKKIIEEIRKLRKIGLSFKRIISFGLEYRWFGMFVKGEIDLDSAFRNCLKDNIRFAKRQIRELKKIEGVNYVKGFKEAEAIFQQFFNK